MTRVTAAILLSLFAALQYRLWVADGGLSHTHRLKSLIAAESAEVAQMRARNAALDAEVSDLHAGLEAVEARARSTLGMIKSDETFYLVVSR
ncbi:septum formation initiator family protein [Algiphilus sp. W345]|uniref:Cell division protein FtsB n=1 Tax=Banduia mediterranea TaxID=3075609 RepID=A0ABU2WMB3_9GAMM|nr:septum formation initiator family protein [Algiphilus sp. W345]MCH9828933.1 septum formation initiator family protein [Gammaproteobacteria bacterium]MDT0499023.1 septum formation initiator family protein [Algiphilus sp. W345]